MHFIMKRTCGLFLIFLSLLLMGCGGNPDRDHVVNTLEKYKGKAEADSQIREMDGRYAKVSSVRKPTFWKDMRAAVDRELAPLAAAEGNKENELKQIEDAARAAVVESSEIPGILENGRGHKPEAVGLKHNGEVVGMVQFSKPEKGWSIFLTLPLKNVNEDYESFPAMVGYNAAGANWEAYNSHAVPGMKCKIGKFEFFVEQSRKHMTIWR